MVDFKLGEYISIFFYNQSHTWLSVCEHPLTATFFVAIDK